MDTSTMESGVDDHTIDIESLISSLERRLSSTNLVMSPTFSIFRIPTILARHNKTSYEPNAFAIGPFHHNNPHLQPTETIKQKYLHDLLSRLPNTTASLRKLTEAISNIHNDARGYYAGAIDMRANDFVDMLLLDGCFIVELFRKNANRSLIDKEKDPIFTMSCLLQFLHHDLILLENQIPWVVLDTLFNLTKTSIDDQNYSLAQLAMKFFPSLLKNKPLGLDSITADIKKSRHILDLYRNTLKSKSEVVKEEEGKHDWKHIRSATGLRDSGIRFQANLTAESLLDMKFDPKSGVMSIPPLLIQETTETVLRNLISLEQCCPNYKPIITCYAVLLDNLIDTSGDIQVLEKSKVIDNWLNVDDATKFFNRLYIDTYVKENYYFSLTSDVNEYYGKRWHKYQRILKRDYFNHPWALVSVIAAFVALVLTFLQTFYAMKEAYN